MSVLLCLIDLICIVRVFKKRNKGVGPKNIFLKAKTYAWAPDLIPGADPTTSELTTTTPAL
jgi:hypothetical protein